MGNVNRSVPSKVFGWVCWGIVIAIFVIWMTAQQITINEMQAELAGLGAEEEDGQDRISELETMNEMYLSDEYIEREARKRGYVHPDDVIFKEAD